MSGFLTLLFEQRWNHLGMHIRMDDFTDQEALVAISSLTTQNRERNDTGLLPLPSYFPIKGGEGLPKSRPPDGQPLMRRAARANVHTSCTSHSLMSVGYCLTAW